MIAVIVCSIVFIMEIILIICGDTNKTSEFLGMGIVVTVFSIFIVAAALCCGKSIYKKDNTKILIGKENIEYLLKFKPSLYIIKEAETFNTNLEFGNNYFCRFSKEDRSEFKIDIDKYISGGNYE